MNNEIPPGTLAIDTRTGRLGQVMDHHAGYVQLRPPRGGIEWNCPPDKARPVRPGPERGEHREQREHRERPA
ncbi:hypothetical protein [Streptomyces mashuensis]|uniref:hypothetical protein n=1 Tax=Streptomyces mashuensis TaxID=33904 RepID=UPI001E5F03E7|nr:hypothetical protein [Streptomyces mashuensis]